MEKNSQILRRELVKRPEPLREIAREAEIDVAQLSRFANDQPGGKLGQDASDRLADYLGLELRPRRRAKR